MHKTREPPPSLDGLDLAEIVRMARDGNKEAFGQLMVYWEPFIKKSLTNALNCPADVDDAYQEIAMSLMGTIKNMKHSNIQGWIRVAMRRRLHVFLIRVKTKGDRLKTGEGANTVLRHIRAREDDPALICERLEIQYDVREAIDRLSEKQQKAMRGVFLNEKTCLEVSKEEEVTRSAISERMQTAKKTLRDSLQQYEHSEI